MHVSLCARFTVCRFDCVHVSLYARLTAQPTNPADFHVLHTEAKLCELLNSNNSRTAVLVTLCAACAVGAGQRDVIRRRMEKKPSTCRIYLVHSRLGSLVCCLCCERWEKRYETLWDGITNLVRVRTLGIVHLRTRTGHTEPEHKIWADSDWRNAVGKFVRIISFFAFPMREQQKEAFCL